MAESGRGVKQRMGLIFGVNFPECLEAQAKTGVTPGICTAFCSFVSWFWRKPELQKVRVELERAYRDIKEYLHLPERETLLQLANLENELGGGNLSDILHRWVPSGYGDRRGVLL